mmetsp:Transcript_71031/g.114561  ORF Transcript_71031/g.114561 Transcript_71031/m.114561 type:complete len:260 (-) Transcript_71031:459-1238(-)
MQGWEEQCQEARCRCKAWVAKAWVAKVPWLREVQVVPTWAHGLGSLQRLSPALALDQPVAWVPEAWVKVAWVLEAWVEAWVQEAAWAMEAWQRRHQPHQHQSQIQVLAWGQLPGSTSMQECHLPRTSAEWAAVWVEWEHLRVAWEEGLLKWAWAATPGWAVAAWGAILTLALRRLLATISRELWAWGLHRILLSMVLDSACRPPEVVVERRPLLQQCQLSMACQFAGRCPPRLCRGFPPINPWRVQTWQSRSCRREALM